MTEAPKRILLAEDDEFLSSLVKNRLERDHFEVATAKDGDEVLNVLKEFKPDLVLLDIILPHKLGFEILEDIQKDPKAGKVPFMVLSNLGQDSDVMRAKELGAVDYFVKARILIDDLVTKIKSYLNVTSPTSPATAPPIPPPAPISL